MRSFFVAILYLQLCSTVLYAQKPKAAKPAPATALALAAITEHPLYSFDIARSVTLFDATPAGDLWFAVDEFGVTKNIIINGVRNETRFSDISSLSTKLSPNGAYLIWMGLHHTFDDKSFNTTQTTVYRHNAGSTVSDLVTTVESDYPSVFFSAHGDHWAALLPASNALQTGLRDVALLDGTMISNGFPRPKMFTFSGKDSSWSYRSSDDRDENIITAAGKQLLFKRSSEGTLIVSDDPAVYRFSPDVRFDRFSLDGRDYDAGLPHTASLYKTSYISSESSQSKQYIVFNHKRQLYSRWIKDIQISPQGDHIVYFASDTTVGTPEQHAIVVRDGVVIAGPYDDARQLFLSPSGTHLAWAVTEGKKIHLYVDGAMVAEIGEYCKIEWSADERTFAFATNDEHDKIFVVTGKKRSPSYDAIGRFAIAGDGTSAEYCAIKYDKLVHIAQRF